MSRPSKRTRASERHQEVNSARLGLVAATRSSALNIRSFDVVMGGRRYKVQIAGMYGIPVGVDADVMLALETLYMLHGCPADRRIQTTARELLSLAGHSEGGNAHSRLRESLQRLLHTTVQISDGWYDATRESWAYERESFRFVDKLKSRDLEIQGQLPELDSEATLVVWLSDDLAQSLNAGYLRVADLRVLESLKEPGTRTLYRFLDAHRNDPGAAPRTELSFTTLQLERMLGLEGRSDSVRRSLERMVSRLVLHQVLERFEFQGSGAQGQWQFYFPPYHDPEVLEAVTLLRGNGVSLKIAESLAGGYALEAVRAAVQRARQIKTQTEARGKQIKSLGGLTHKILLDPEAYAADPGAAQTPPKRGVPVHRPPREGEEKLRPDLPEPLVNAAGVAVFLNARKVSIERKALERAQQTGVDLSALMREVLKRDLRGDALREYLEAEALMGGSRSKS